MVNIMDIKYRIDEGKSYLDIAKDNVDLSTKNINFEVQKYYIAVGLNNFIELQDAQTNYNNAQLAFVQSVFDYNVAREEFKKSMGVR